MGRFQRSERGGQVDPQEALRRARESVARERSERGEGWGDEESEPRREEELDPVEDALEERDDAVDDEG
jgi:hypothetical protein